MDNKNELLRRLPKVDVLLLNDNFTQFAGIPKTLVLEAINEILNKYRQSILDSSRTSVSIDELIKEIRQELSQKMKPNYKRVINGTGTILHTNLGRATLSNKAVEAAIVAASTYTNLEYNLDNGQRGDRNAHVEALLCQLTGAEAAIVVNNNAAGVLLVLSALSRGKEVIVSRGELVEIGGAFRIPEIMELSGSKLVEIGTTNKTKKADYVHAINDNTGLIMKVNQSNFKIIGFTEEVSIKELSEISKLHNIPVIYDIGSGLLIDSTILGIGRESTVKDSIKSGADIVMFSGDKLMGGPQCGVITGKKEYVDQLRYNPLLRALRIDKLTLAALEATLKSYLDIKNALKELPVLSMISMEASDLKKNARYLSKSIMQRTGEAVTVQVTKDFSTIGGGTLPVEKLETYVIELSSPHLKLNEFEHSLRNNTIPIITRISNDKIIIDVRTLFKEDYRIIVHAIDNIIGNIIGR